MIVFMKDRVYFVLLAGGFLGMVAQLVFAREFLGIFFGNELVFGLILGNWLLLGAVGSFLGRYSARLKEKVLVLALVLFLLAVFFPVLVYFSRAVGSYVSLAGELVSVQGIIVSTFLILAFFCVLNGFQFILCCGMLSESGRDSGIGMAYLLESAGALAGGVAFTYVLGASMNAFQISYLVSAVYFTCVLALTFGRSRLAYFALAFAVLFLIFVPSLGLQDLTNRLQYPGQDVLAQRNTPYGNIVVTRTGSQINFFENGLPLFSSGNVIESEEDVHYAMSQHPQPKSVLLVSGGVFGTLREVLKYGVGRVDYVEIDPAVIELSREYVAGSGLDDGRVFVHQTDGRAFLNGGAGTYDVVLVNVHDPVNAQLNRFYTSEFFGEVKRHLAVGGVVSLSLSSPGDYISPESGVLMSGVFWTLKKSFRNVIVVPGGRTYFIASDKELSYDIGGLIARKGVQTKFVNDNYLRGVLTRERINYLLDSMKKESAVNTDFKPVAYFRQTAYWSRKFGFGYAGILVLGLAVAAVMLVATKPAQLSVFTVGFMGTAIEVVFFVAYQIAYGSVYQKVGLIVASFMLGMTAGAWWANRIQGIDAKRHYVKLVLAAAVFPLAAAFSLSHLQGQVAYFSLTAVCGLLVGLAFPLAAKAEGDAGLLYSLDLLGAFVGSVTAGAILIPAAGLINTCLIAAALNALGLVRLRLSG